MLNSISSGLNVFKCEFDICEDVRWWTFISDAFANSRKNDFHFFEYHRYTSMKRYLELFISLPIVNIEIMCKHELFNSVLS